MPFETKEIKETLKNITKIINPAKNLEDIDFEKILEIRDQAEWFLNTLNNFLENENDDLNIDDNITMVAKDILFDDDDSF